MSIRPPAPAIDDTSKLPDVIRPSSAVTVMTPPLVAPVADRPLAALPIICPAATAISPPMPVTPSAVMVPLNDSRLATSIAMEPPLLPSALMSPPMLAVAAAMEICPPSNAPSPETSICDPSVLVTPPLAVRLMTPLLSATDCARTMPSIFTEELITEEAARAVMIIVPPSAATVPALLMSAEAPSPIVAAISSPGAKLSKPSPNKSMENPALAAMVTVPSRADTTPLFINCGDASAAMPPARMRSEPLFTICAPLAVPENRKLPRLVIKSLSEKS